MPAVLLAVAAFAAAAAGAAPASAAEVVSASGRVLLDGREVRVEPGKPLPFRRGARIETTAASAATVRADAGDEVRLGAGALLRSDGTQGGTEYLLLVAGSADANLGARTCLGTSAGWAGAATGSEASVRATCGEAGTSTFRAVRGPAWVRCAFADVWLPEGAAAALRPGAEGSGSLGFEAPADAAAAFTIATRTGERDGARVPAASAIVPPSAAGAVAEASAAGATRWTCRRAPKDGALRVEARLGTTRRLLAALGSGVRCVADPGGAVVVEVPGIEPARLRRLLALEAAFESG